MSNLLLDVKGQNEQPLLIKRIFDAIKVFDQQRLRFCASDDSDNNRDLVDYGSVTSSLLPNDILLRNKAKQVEILTRPAKALVRAIAVLYVYDRDNAVNFKIDHNSSFIFTCHTAVEILTEFKTVFDGLHAENIDIVFWQFVALEMANIFNKQQSEVDFENTISEMVANIRGGDK